MKRFLLLVIIITSFIFTGCQLVAEREEIKVSAVITDLQYEDSYIDYWYVYNASIKTVAPISMPVPAKYLVTITYEDVSETFADKILYESVKEGDTIQMVLCKCYDAEGNLIEQTLQLPE